MTNKFCYSVSCSHQYQVSQNYSKCHHCHMSYIRCSTTLFYDELQAFRSYSSQQHTLSHYSITKQLKSKAILAEQQNPRLQQLWPTEHSVKNFRLGKDLRDSSKQQFIHYCNNRHTSHIGKGEIAHWSAKPTLLYTLKPTQKMLSWWLNITGS